MSYQITGNKIPVTKDELIIYMKEQLSAFDSGMSKNTNPYTDAIIYNTKDGKMIQIPQEIQKEAITLWNQQPKKFNLPMNENDDNDKPDYITIGILILAVILAIYLFNKSGLNIMFMGPDTKYYLVK